MRRLKLLAALLVVGLVATLLASSGTAQAAAAGRVKVGAAAAVTEQGRVTLTVRCAAARACRGTLRLRGTKATTTKVRYAVGARRSKKVVVRLSAAQLSSFPRGGRRSVAVQVWETKPVKRTVRSSTVAIRRTAAPVTPPVDPPVVPPVTPPTSEAYRTRNWKPTAFDTCSEALHKTYSVIGPDGKIYPTWHPPTVLDPATGTTCTFGHEHGDDPATSDIHTWVTDFINADHTRGRGIPFGYVSEALDTYAAERDKVTRHEDNVGHKIIVANDVRPVGQSPRTLVRDSAGNPISCDYLMKIHQGTHSGDALINNAHEMLFAGRCSDGTEVISSTMTKFGDANEFLRSCDRTLVTTSGSNLPDGYGGGRRIPDTTCVDRDVLKPNGAASSVWSLYEVWESVNKITTPGGDVLASFDPWFGVRNPARAHESGSTNVIIDMIWTAYVTDPSDGGTATGYPWDEVHQHHAAHPGTPDLLKQDPLSPFDGAQRDYYLQETTVDNAAGPTTWFTGPYGDNAVTTAAPGLVRQHVSSTDNTSWPVLERVVRDLQKDHGAGNGVHAPN